MRDLAPDFDVFATLHFALIENLGHEFALGHRGDDRVDGGPAFALAEIKVNAGGDQHRGDDSEYHQGADVSAARVSSKIQHFDIFD